MDAILKNFANSGKNNYENNGIGEIGLQTSTGESNVQYIGRYMT